MPGGSGVQIDQDTHWKRDSLVNGLGYDGTGRPGTQWALQAGSPAINHGTNVCAGLTGCTTGARDFFGDPVPLGGAFDIGADEAQ